MNSKRRFLSLKYLEGTLRRRLQQRSMQRSNGVNPFTLYKDDISYENITINPVLGTELASYHSFSYMDFDKAKDYYKECDFFICRVMLLLFEHNSKQSKIGIKKWLQKVDNLLNTADKTEEGLIFYTNETANKFKVKGENYSGIIQAKVTSLLLRAYKESKDDKYLKAAYQCLLACKKPFNQSGIMVSLAPDATWIEEYQSPQPSLVLNGFVFFMIALAEYIILDNRSDIVEFYEKSTIALKAWLPQFVQKDFILYSMYDWTFANVHYMGIMKYQFEHLCKLVPDVDFQDFLNIINKGYDEKLFRKILY